MIKAVTFDLWNTLFENISYKEERIKLLSGWLKTQKPDFKIPELRKHYEKFFSFINPDYEALKLHHVYTEKKLKDLLKAFNANPPQARINYIIEKLESVMLANPPGLKSSVKEIIPILSQKYKLGIISDTGITPGRIIKKVLEDYDLLKYFTTTIFSDETGLYKPHPIAFKTALANLKTIPEHAVHIGDLLETDIKGAKDCNMHAILFKDHAQKRADDIEPDYEVDELSEIVEIIDRL